MTNNLEEDENNIRIIGETPDDNTRLELIGKYLNASSKRAKIERLSPDSDVPEEKLMHEISVNEALITSRKNESEALLNLLEFCYGDKPKEEPKEEEQKAKVNDNIKIKLLIPPKGQQDNGKEPNQDSTTGPATGT